MIGSLSGILLEKKAPHILIEVVGIGYELMVPMSTFYDLPDTQNKLRLLTQLVIRDNAHTLYGFLDTKERDLFRALIKVSGIGPKVGLSILSSMSTQNFIKCIQTDDITHLRSTPGIGKKTAERLIIELRNRTSEWETTQTTLQKIENDSQQEAISALISLGYKSNEAKRSIARVFQTDLSSEEIIKLALQKMVSR